MDDLSSRTAGRRGADHRDGSPLNVEARKGVLLAAGGFGHNADMRRRYSGDQPNEAQWSIANAGDTGEVLQTAMRLGAKTDLLDEAWWLPSVFIANGGAAAASLGSGTATARGHLRRFDRPAVLQRVELLCRGRQGDVRQQGGAVLDGLRRGVCAPVRFGRQPVEEAPPARRADRQRGPSSGPTRIGDLARQIDVPADELEQTIDAVQRVRGQGPRPGLRARPVGVQRLPRRSRVSAERRGRTARPRAVLRHRVLPADVGTCGGVVTNEHAQVLDEHDRVIDGLYATGNITATVMGRTYLRRRRQHREHDGVRLRRSPARRRPLIHASLNSSRRPVKSRGFMPDCMSSARRA